MKQTRYRLEKDKYLSVSPCAGLPAQLAEGEADYWQEIETAVPDELAAWINTQAVHPLMVEDILESEHGTLIDRYSDAVYIEFPAIPDNNAVGVDYLSLILTPQLIVTIHRGEIPEMEAVVERLSMNVSFGFLTFEGSKSQRIFNQVDKKWKP